MEKKNASKHILGYIEINIVNKIWVSMLRTAKKYI